MRSSKEAQGQNEIPEGHCIEEGKLLHFSETPPIYWTIPVK